MKTLSVFAFVAIFAALGCSKKSSSVPDDKPTGVYQTRGILKSTPKDGRVAIFHEEIPDFKTVHGKTTKMMAMQMQFGYRSTVSFDGFLAGDKVAFTFETHFKHKPAIWVTKIEKLPAETKLGFD